ncbi:transposase [Streptomyces sp. NBC_00525]|uniref:transposase n=1 Tax=Streptomyces sp. NBC_00525 TaxID=2903660 RepID=UPI002E808C19|nr:transposase [Streptomyces sp. NBC_00525]
MCSRRPTTSSTTRPHRSPSMRRTSWDALSGRSGGTEHNGRAACVGSGVPLTEAQWARIEPLLPDRTPKRGGRWRDHREVIDAIAWKFQTGSQWVHLPAKYGNWRGVYNRLRM